MSAHWTVDQHFHGGRKPAGGVRSVVLIGTHLYKALVEHSTGGAANSLVSLPWVDVPAHGVLSDASGLEVCLIEPHFLEAERDGNGDIVAGTVDLAQIPSHLTFLQVLVHEPTGTPSNPLPVISSWAAAFVQV